MSSDPADSLADLNQRPTRPVRVLVVAPSLDILGGQAVQAESLLRGLRDESLVDAAFLPVNPRLPGALRALQSIKYVRTGVTSLWYLAALMRRVPKYDVIHVFAASYLSFVLSPTPAIVIAKLFGKKTVLNYHSGQAEDHLSRWASARLTLHLPDRIVVPSDYLVQTFSRFGFAAQAIRNTVDLDAFEFRERTDLRPLFLSNRNLEAHYGVDCVLLAFAKVQKVLPEAALTVAGDGSERRALEGLARDLHVQNVEFRGMVDHYEVDALYDSSDIFLNGAIVDNQPLSVLEAFACGLPVITTDAGGLPDLVTDNRTGLLVGRGDADALAEKALYLLDNPDVARSMSRQAREECGAYTWNAVREEWLTLYAALAQPRRQAAESRFVA